MTAFEQRQVHCPAVVRRYRAALEYHARTSSKLTPPDPSSYHPNPQWHGRTCTVLGVWSSRRWGYRYGAIRFPDDPPRTYHLIKPRFLRVARD